MCMYTLFVHDREGYKHRHDRDLKCRYKCRHRLLHPHPFNGPSIDMSSGYVAWETYPVLDGTHAWRHRLSKFERRRPADLDEAEEEESSKTAFDSEGCSRQMAELRVRLCHFEKQVGSGIQGHGRRAYKPGRRVCSDRLGHVLLLHGNVHICACTHVYARHIYVFSRTYTIYTCVHSKVTLCWHQRGQRKC